MVGCCQLAIMRRIFDLTTHRCSKLLSNFTIRKRGVRGAHCFHGCYGRRAVSACVVHILSLLRKLMVYSLPEDEKPDIHISPTLQHLQQRKSIENQEILNYERSRKRRHVSVSRSSPFLSAAHNSPVQNQERLPSVSTTQSTSPSLRRRFSSRPPSRSSRVGTPTTDASFSFGMNQLHPSNSPTSPCHSTSPSLSAAHTRPVQDHERLPPLSPTQSTNPSLRSRSCSRALPLSLIPPTSLFGSLPLPPDAEFPNSRALESPSLPNPSSSALLDASGSGSAPPGRAAVAAGGQPTNWDFAKRKRWADLLITELSDTIILILAPTCKIIYCGQAIQELLGWNDVDLVDYDFLGLISGEYFILIVPATFVILNLAFPPLLAVEDQYAFRMNFQTAIIQRKSLLTHIRLKHRSPSPTIPPKETLYEFNGYPHFATEDGQPTSSCQCFIAMARPYHTHNTALWVLSPSL
jgi:hypothetical protein